MGTEEELLALLRKAALHKMTPEEIFEQRVSWVYGQLPHTDLRTLSEIREEARRIGGYTTLAPVTPIAEGRSDELMKLREWCLITFGTTHPEVRDAERYERDSEAILLPEDGDIVLKVETDEELETYPDGAVLRSDPRLRACVRMTLQSRDDTIRIQAQHIAALTTPAPIPPAPVGIAEVQRAIHALKAAVFQHVQTGSPWMDILAQERELMTAITRFAGGKDRERWIPVTEGTPPLGEIVLIVGGYGMLTANGWYTAMTGTVPRPIQYEITRWMRVPL